MRVRLKYALPAVQIALAVLSVRQSFLWDIAARGNDAPGKHPAFKLLICINLPVSVVLKPILVLPGPTLWDSVMFVTAIGMFWYWIALRIQRYKERRTLFLFAWLPLRITTDMFLIALGASLAWLLIVEARDYPHNSPISPNILGWWFVPTFTSLLLWALGPIFIFGSDLIWCLRREQAR